VVLRLGRGIHHATHGGEHCARQAPPPKSLRPTDSAAAQEKNS
jgi:hypothetical protein